jgi:Holliday junction resolvasome RuvABC endonuclease subunit
MKNNISIDPGTNHTGYCIWRNGRVVDIGTINVPAKLSEFVHKIFHTTTALKKIFSNCQMQGGINKVAVEEFEWHSNGHDRSMMKCNAVRGGILVCAALYTNNVLSVSKKQIKKTETRLLAESMRVIEKNQRISKDALDAFQIGICAGFDANHT